MTVCLPQGAMRAAEAACGTTEEREAFLRGVLWATEIGSPNAATRVAPILPAFVSAVRSAIAYDLLIQDCANDPQKMASATTAQGDDLDSLYEDWITKSRKALAAIEIIDERPTAGNPDAFAEQVVVDITNISERDGTSEKYDEAVKIVRAALQESFDLGFKAAGGTIGIGEIIL